MKMKFDSIIFDMDGVLVSNSAYRAAIRRTVGTILLNLYGLKISVRDTYIEEIKKITGFNNDWDTSYALVKLLGRNVPVAGFRDEVLQITPAVRDGMLYKDIKNIFQSLYLGENNTGLISEETLLPDNALLSELSRMYKTGIATSRPRYEALFAVKNLKISPQYIPENCIVAKEDTPNEKPSPEPLLEARLRMNAKNPVYIGDTINDTVAAKSAGMVSIYIGSEDYGDINLTEVSKLREVLL